MSTTTLGEYIYISFTITVTRLMPDDTRLERPESVARRDSTRRRRSFYRHTPRRRKPPRSNLLLQSNAAADAHYNIECSIDKLDYYTVLYTVVYNYLSCYINNIWMCCGKQQTI